MQFNFDRFRVFPELLKLSTIVTTIFIILFLSVVKEQPPGTSFIWINCILAIIIDCLFIMTIGLELENSLFPINSLLNWPLLECIFSSLFSINFFISIWLSFNSKFFSDESTAYSLSATFCLANFIQYTLNIIYHIRNWINEQRKAMQVIDPRGIGINSYGGP
ncbi:MARVEL domain-containing protein [Meloidogyne graminicola]|uniref:MARVEL domain-containing protein n=1 Tax=Meloidogyne graminicola TaxID=189291 RepID=A0A8S9ZXB3_9BILA|nr:MARVEL domain-containing protein [Meloidogyne graminicola]